MGKWNERPQQVPATCIFGRKGELVCRTARAALKKVMKNARAMGATNTQVEAIRAAAVPVYSQVRRRGRKFDY